MKRWLSGLVVGLAVVVAGCTTQTSETSGVLKAMVTVLPQTEFVKAVGGDLVEVNAMIPPGYNPATYDPSPQQMKQLADADVYFRIGKVAFETTNIAQLKAANPELEFVDTSREIEFREIESHTHEGEAHEGEEHDESSEHGEEAGEHELDPHVWMSPTLVKSQVEVIADELSVLKPESAAVFEANKEEYLAALTELDQELSGLLQPHAGKTVLVYHPAFGYLLDEYGLEQQAIEISGKEPSLREIELVVEEAREKQVAAVFVQVQFSTKSVEALAQELGVPVVRLNPLAANYIENMRLLAEKLVENL